MAQSACALAKAVRRLQAQFGYYPRRKSRAITKLGYAGSPLLWAWKVGR